MPLGWTERTVGCRIRVRAFWEQGIFRVKGGCHPSHDGFCYATAICPEANLELTEGVIN